MKSGPAHIKISIENNISELEKVAGMYEKFASSQQLPSRINNAVLMVLDEILNNIINYAYTDNDAHEINIYFSILEDRLCLQIEDDGKPFNPLEIPKADRQSKLEDRPIGGLGIHLTKSIMDNLTYNYKNRKNCLLLEKNL